MLIKSINQIKSNQIQIKSIQSNPIQINPNPNPNPNHTNEWYCSLITHEIASMRRAHMKDQTLSVVTQLDQEIPFKQQQQTTTTTTPNNKHQIEFCESIKSKTKNKDQ